MKITKTPFTDLLIVEPGIFEDSRGYFFESYNKKAFKEAGIEKEFVQDNQSNSKRGVLRGLHFQKSPFGQTKLVRVLSGVIQDVAVDMRESQPTYGKYFSIELSFANKKQLLIPDGFAHGFLVLSESADVFYKCDEYYHPESEGGISFNDPQLNIEWNLPADKLLVSSRDQQHPRLPALARK